MATVINETTAKPKRRSPEYFIISLSYWYDDGWAIEVAGIRSRKDAKARLRDFVDGDWEINQQHTSRLKLYDSLQSRIATYTECKRLFGRDLSNWPYQSRGYNGG